jgi:hypothetical protein
MGTSSSAHEQQTVRTAVQRALVKEYDTFCECTDDGRVPLTVTNFSTLDDRGSTKIEQPERSNLVEKKDVITKLMVRFADSAAKTIRLELQKSVGPKLKEALFVGTQKFRDNAVAMEILAARVRGVVRTGLFLHVGRSQDTRGNLHVDFTGHPLVVLDSDSHDRVGRSFFRHLGLLLALNLKGTSLEMGLVGFSRDSGLDSGAMKNGDDDDDDVLLETLEMVGYFFICVAVLVIIGLIIALVVAAKDSAKIKRLLYKEMGRRGWGEERIEATLSAAV